MDLQGLQQHAQGMMQGPPSPMTPLMARSPMPPPMNPPQQSGAGLPPPPVLMQLAQEAKALDPMMLGALIFHALKQSGQPLSPQGITSLAQ